MVDALWFLLGQHPVRSLHRKPPIFYRYYAPSWEDGVKAVLLKKIQELVPRSLLKGGSWASAWSNQARTLRFKNGSVCRFFTYEQDVGKMGGDDLDGATLDEHAPHNVFIETIARLVDRDGYIVLTMTPESGITWEADDIIEASEFDKDIDFWHFSTYDNPHLSQEGIKQLEKLITDERLRDAKLRGRFVALSGLVYPQFDKALHVVPDKELPAHWHRQFIIDPHHRKDSAMLWRAISPEGISYTYREGSFSPDSGGVPELAEYIRTRSAPDEKIAQWIIDEAMGGEEKQLYGDTIGRQLVAAGIPVVGTNLESSKAFAAGIDKVRSKLNPNPIDGKPSHFIFASCTETVKQFMRYRYRKETSVDDEMLRENVANINDDYVTCDRYGMMGEPFTGKMQTKPHIALPPGQRGAYTGMV